MTRFRELFERLTALLFRRAHERRLDEDIRCHIELATDENIRKGMTPAKAAREARRHFGNSGLMKERYRDQLGMPHVAGLSWVWARVSSRW